MTGWVGRGLAPAIAQAPDLELSGAVCRSQAGRPLAEALGDASLPSLIVRGAVSEALADGADVFVDYTSASAVRAHVAEAIARGVHVVVGSSGLSDEEYAGIDRAARERGVGVLAAGNFALTAVLLQRFAEIAARQIPQWEIIDYAGAKKPDAPSGTARELGARLSGVRTPEIGVPVEKTLGVARGPGRVARRDAGALRPAAGLRLLDRGAVRPSRRAAHDPARFVVERRALHRRDAAGDPPRVLVHRPAAGARQRDGVLALF